MRIAPTQKQRILYLFSENNNVLTLGQLLQYPFGYKATSRFSDLRKEGYVITCEKGRTPSQNVYRLVAPEANGQLRLA